MKGLKITLLCIAASLIFVGSAFAQFPQHYAKETPIGLWTWVINWGGNEIPIKMVFPNLIANQELPIIAPDWYGVISGNRVRWYFAGAIRKPISDILLCITGKVFKEQFPQTDGYVAQTGRSADSPVIPLDPTDQPLVSAWAMSADYEFAQPFVPMPVGGLPESGSWNPYYLTARILPMNLFGNVVLARTAPGIPGGFPTSRITLVNGFEICVLIRLPVTGTATEADFDGDRVNPFNAVILNDSGETGEEAEVSLASGDRIGVQLDILPGHLHNIYISTTTSVIAKYLTPNP